MKIIIEDNSVTIEGSPTISELLTATFQLQLSILNNASAAVPEIKNDLYDMYNLSASNVLSTFIPDKELRPDLTEVAIMQKEDEIISRMKAEAEKFQKMPALKGGPNRAQRRKQQPHVVRVSSDT